MNIILKSKQLMKLILKYSNLSKIKKKKSFLFYFFLLFYNKIDISSELGKKISSDWLIVNLNIM